MAPPPARTAGAIKASVQIDGAKELMAKLRTEDPIYADPLRVALLTAAEDVRDEARKLAPMKTGALRASLVAAISAAPVPKWGRVKSKLKRGKFPYPLALEISDKYHYRRTKRPTKGFLIIAFIRRAARVNELLEKAATTIENRWGS